VLRCSRHRCAGSPRGCGLRRPPWPSRADSLFVIAMRCWSRSCCIGVIRVCAFGDLCSFLFLATASHGVIGARKRRSRC
jgi:hypothetical protein